MSILKQLSKDGLEQTEDRVGGGSFTIPSGVHLGKVEYAYLDTYKSGSHFLALSIKWPDGKTFRDQLFIAKANGENFWEKDGKKTAFPGYTILDDLALMITGFEASDLDEPEEKIIKKRNFETGQDENVAVQMLTQLVGGDVALGIIESIETKMEKNPSTGEYDIPTDTEFKKNTIDKVFHPETLLTVTEARNGLEQGQFVEKWKEANEGKLRDKRYKGNKAVKSGAPARSPASAGAAPKPGAPAGGAAKKPLFGVKK